MITNNWFVLALLSAFFIGLQSVFIKMITNSGLTVSLITTYVFSVTTLFLWAYIFFTQKIVLPSIKISGLLIGMAVIAFVSNLSQVKSFQLAANPGYVRAIFSLSTLFAFILSLFIFDLKFTAMSAFGILLLIVGTIILSVYA